MAIDSTASSSVSNKTKKTASRKSSVLESLMLYLAVPIIFVGWYTREHELFSAETGWGYDLGIIGGVMMLVLMLYPLRKHAKFMRNFGHVRFWFRFHMALGVMGPIAVLYHSNFGFGSVNSNVALISMLVVACSGVIGRFVYSKIHFGLYGRKATFEELQTTLHEAKNKVEQKLGMSSDQLMEPLISFEKKYVPSSDQSMPLILGIGLLPLLSVHRIIALRKFKRNLILQLKTYSDQKKLSDVQVESLQIILNNYAIKYFSNASKMIEFSVYERMFSLWHMLHLPLFFIMVSTGLFHVYAVHMY